MKKNKPDEKNQPKITGFTTKNKKNSENVTPITPTVASPKPRPGVKNKGEPIFDLKAFLNRKKLEFDQRQAQQRRASASPSCPEQTSMERIAAKRAKINSCGIICQTRGEHEYFC